MAEIPLADLKVGDRVVATQMGGNTSYTGSVAEISRNRYRGKEDILVWLDRKGGTAHDIGLRLRGGEDPPQWTFVEDPTVKEYKKRSRGLAEVSAFKRGIPEDVLNYKLAPMLGLKKTGTARRSVRKQTRRRRVVRRLIRS